MNDQSYNLESNGAVADMPPDTQSRRSTLSSLSLYPPWGVTTFSLYVNLTLPAIWEPAHTILNDQKLILTYWDRKSKPVVFAVRRYFAWNKLVCWWKPRNGSAHSWRRIHCEGQQQLLYMFLDSSLRFHTFLGSWLGIVGMTTYLDGRVSTSCSANASLMNNMLTSKCSSLSSQVWPFSIPLHKSLLSFECRGCKLLFEWISKHGKCMVVICGAT